MNSDVRVLESSDGLERVIIAKRPDGNYTYRRQWRSRAANFHPDSPISAEAPSLRAGEWDAPGPDCGIYNSPDTAEMEARQRVPWLRQQFR
jgi:hypothetical protein